jgi:rifampin ADP-ribosylating transferase
MMVLSHPLPIDPNAPPAPPVTFKNCSAALGPFYHGTKAKLQVGDKLVPGQAANFQENHISNYIYFSALIDAWWAEVAQGEGEGHFYIVEPTGPFEDDPNLTNKRFQGNPTQSYRTKEPLQVVGEVLDWDGHPPEIVQKMRKALVDNMKKGEGRVID